jgi:mannose-1-phosphate guanylyltransferase
MKLILLSGGSGKRLWPMSNEARSKQFLKVLVNNEGQKESMVQRVWRQIKSVNLENSTVIATNKEQVDILKNQLGDEIPIIVEPERRDTFPAIALAVTYLYSVVGVGLNEVIVTLPIDSFVEEQFFNKVKELEHTLTLSEANLALIGVKPTSPSEKYGYIIPGSKIEGNQYYSITSFREKPNAEQAKSLINMKAFWNCGVFGFKLEYILLMLIEKKYQ